MDSVFKNHIIKDFGMEIFISNDKMLSFMFENNIFINFDLLIYLLAIEQAEGKNDFGNNILAHFLKVMDMSSLYLKEENSYYFIKANHLATQKNNFESILLNKNCHIINGINAVAHDFLSGIDSKVHFIENGESIPITLDWLSKNGFLDSHIQMLIDKCDDLKLKHKKEFISIVWPPAFKYSNQILNYFKERFKINHVCIYDFEDQKLFWDFLSDLYEVDDIERWKIKVKFDHMIIYGYKCFIFNFALFENDYIKRLINNIYVPMSVSVNNAKQAIRKEVSILIDDYFYDIALHISDNHFETVGILKVLEKYSSYKKERLL